MSRNTQGRKRKRTLPKLGKRSDWKLIFALLAAVTLVGLLGNQSGLRISDRDTKVTLAPAESQKIDGAPQTPQDKMPWTTLAGSTPLKRWSKP